MAMLHVVDPNEEDEEDKLRKVSSFLEFFKQKYKDLYQPFQHVAVDERMVKSKHQSGMRQYIKNKPTKWGIKLWVLADSLNGYTCDFDVYIGRNAGQEVSPNGLGYDVVMKLVAPLRNQGYHLRLLQLPVYTFCRPIKIESFDNQTSKFTCPLGNVLAPVSQMIVADFIGCFVRQSVLNKLGRNFKQGVPLSSDLRNQVIELAQLHSYS